MMIESSKKCKRQLTFELEDSYVFEKRSNLYKFGRWLRYHQSKTVKFWILAGSWFICCFFLKSFLQKKG